MKTIATVFTCHNRVKKTYKCLKSLSESIKDIADDYRVIVYVCDDGSTDGTVEMLRSFSSLDIRIASGTGNLFWAKGMRKAIDVAERDNPDYYLFINDDVEFYHDFIRILLNNYEKNRCAIVGCTLDDKEQECSYGGFTWDNKSLYFRKNYRRVKPESADRSCKWANWNCILLPAGLYNRVGKIDDYYEHGFADYDYSNRIIKSGERMIVADKYVGICNRNKKEGTYLDNSLPIKERFRLMHKKTGRPPKSCWHYASKFFGITAPLVFIEPYLYVLVTSSPMFKLIRH